ncbi:F-box protein At5g03970-like [Triticum dicoccoides]|uniref:F-box protein At5g03970-like n=1 Tax=Triticum dicoccoides TaxID=85692 RepID=UPI001890D157|nr:F-box protein At5g03970-like [Triticum dicoccoides]
MSSRRRRHARSPPAAPLDDDDLLSEILLRLPPQPSSLPRASLVCKRWRGLVSDPGFFRRFRLRHRRNPPLLGFFDRFLGQKFRSTLEAPNRVPPERFSLQRHEDEMRSFSHGCRHGLVLISLLKRHQVLVWDPVTSDQHRIPFPAPFDTAVVNAAVLRDAGDAQHFQVVLAVAGTDAEHHRRALACIYSSKTGLWGDLVSTPIPYQANGNSIPTLVYTDDAVLDGDSLYWKLVGNLIGILEFDLKKQTLAVIQVPMDILKGNSLQVMRAEGGGLGFLFVSDSDCTARLWKRKTNRHGFASWELARSIDLDKLLSLEPEEKAPLVILGYAELNNVVFLQTAIGVLMVQLESLKFKKLFKTMTFSRYHPFESVYGAGACITGGHARAELMLNA